jgi:hypothetical protein
MDSGYAVTSRTPPSGQISESQIVPMGSAPIRLHSHRRKLPQKLKAPGLSASSKEFVSTPKLQANRENSKKSTGPKTAVGKATSPWNSVRHGLLSKRLVTSANQDKERSLVC